MAGHADEPAPMMPSESEGRPSTSRRRFLTGIGASGLAVAAAVFGRSTPAFATTNVGCCALEHGPDDQCYKPFATCAARPSPWIWSCKRTNPPLLCQCCEGSNPGHSCLVPPNNTMSGASCQHG